jgi:4-amino-4-deoxy-L-arabinose transferase-like glycosyltransferase
MAWAGVLGVAAVAAVALIVTAGRYGPHRDELYFIVAGRHPSFGYPDQPPLTPILAWAMDALHHGSLLVLRAPAIVAGFVSTVATGLLARELGGERRAQVLAAACWAFGAVSIVTGHFLTTTTYDVCATAVVSWLLARLLRTGDVRLWGWIGLAVGIGLLNKLQVGIITVLLVAVIAWIGPREVLRTRWLLVAAGLAALGAAPYVGWQLTHGVPQTALARSIAQSGAEGGRIGYVPFQIVLISVFLVPVWIAGIVALARDPRLRVWRCFVVAYPIYALAMIATGGKAYYQAGFYPVLLAAGAPPVLRWLERGRRAVRVGILGLGIALTFAISAVVGLGVLPSRDLQGSAVMALNPDAGEQVGWPRFVDTVAHVYDLVPAAARARTVIFTDNYGEAGAIDYYRARFGLPHPYSGHNGWTMWGPPPARDATTVLVADWPRRRVMRFFVGCTVRAHINDRIGLDNQEQGVPVWLCRSTRRPWPEQWRALRHYD